MTNIKKNKTKVELFTRLFSIENNWENVLYVHTPFCMQKCFYCIYLSKEPDSKEEMEIFYNRWLPAQIQDYQTILEKVKFQQVYFGGGTPTIVDAETLAKIYKKIPGFETIPLKATEVSPYTVTDEHIELFHKFRFKYVSIGVQTLSERILKKQNRLWVDKEKLHHLCRRLDRCGMISNIDLIFYLDSGGLEDLDQTRQDLDYVMSTLKPVSITLHYNYMSKKSFEKRKAMIRLTAEMVQKYPEYLCVNSLLEEKDIPMDMDYSAEYRLMRKNKDFIFYMLPKFPESHTYGHNMLALGEYKQFKTRENYFYIFDFIDKYAYREMLKKLDSFIVEFNRVRNKLALAPQKYVMNEDFFIDEDGKEQFKEIVTKYGIPFHDFGNLQEKC